MKIRSFLLGALACSALATTSALAPHLTWAQAPLMQPGVTQDHPFLHPLFSDNAVLQRDRAIPVWGWAASNTAVTVSLDGKTSTAQTDATGKWMARIGPYPAGGPHTMTVTGGGMTETRQNLLFGDVWICSGQSNMEFGVGNGNSAQAEIAAANYPQIRLFTVPKETSVAPRDTVKGNWLVCTPENIAKSGTWNGFSAAGYFFGRKLNQELKVPIGLLLTSWGGTIAEAWVSESALGTLPDFKTNIAAVKSVATDPRSYDQRVAGWMRENNIGTEWAASDFNDQAWQNIKVPAYWQDVDIAGLNEFDGYAWYRRSVNVPAAWAGHDLTIQLGAIDDADTSYWNGVEIGSTNGWNTQRQYTIPGAQVKAGRNVIAVRVLDTGGNGGMFGPDDRLQLSLDANNKLSLAGQWKFKLSSSLAQLTPQPLRLDNSQPNTVTVLYNAMIAPLVPYGVKGAIWYQGESNADRPEQYGRLLPTMINDWRRRFDTPLPFYIVQLAGFMAPDQEPRNDNWPLLRAAQQRTADTVGRSGLAIATDIGDERDIHPKDKQDVGLRLALNALAKDYGKPVEYSGPVIKSATREGTNLVLTFTHNQGGLTLKGDTGRGFAVAGADKNWFWANARVEGNRVILNSPVVTAPLYVRFAWSNLPQAALYNGAGLPTAPFQLN